MEERIIELERKVEEYFKELNRLGTEKIGTYGDLKKLAVDNEKQKNTDKYISVQITSPTNPIIVNLLIPTLVDKSRLPALSDKELSTIKNLLEQIRARES